VESSNVLVASPRRDLQSGVVPSGNGKKSQANSQPDEKYAKQPFCELGYKKKVI